MARYGEKEKKEKKEETKKITEMLFFFEIKKEMQIPS